ncbi:UvrD-helicase domain-containing protein [Serinibacter salmoneus]|uniref:DNA 3'-5' helicase n=1 Tax=Serinibacter salmoneus TaxID=556530 RepID=A0A2A9CVU2_9MICO|nr:UvrD-helicase domain-containing protein [Serinibacter salmoneus]PFG18537.1 UvrD-like helicase family protein [Serinibacter salmoneus]
MPQIIMGPAEKSGLDGSVKKAAYSFLEKLREDDTVPGLHIEPIALSADPRVRTGRVNDFWRALLVKLTHGGATSYVYLGTYAHDDAIALAKTASVRINPINGIAEFIKVGDGAASAGGSVPVAQGAADQGGPAGPGGAAPSGTTVPPKPAPEDRDTTAYPFLETQGVSVADLTGLGFTEAAAKQAVTISDDDSLESFAGRLPTWQGVALIDLAYGKSVEAVREAYSIPSAPRDTSRDDTDEALLAALKHPASRAEFAFIEGQEELREVIENADFARWRIYLHPEQRTYAERDRNGAFRLSGGAGTGKTVVLVHRARLLARANPQARIVLTTFNRTLADSLREQLLSLDPEVPLAKAPGQPGVYVGGVDQVAYQVLREAGSALAGSQSSTGAVAQVLGPRTAQVLQGTAPGAWAEAIAVAGSSLPEELRSESFFIAEYATVVLPGRLTARGEYLRARRPGRKVPLGRAQRSGVWDVIEAYRAAAAAAGTADFEEKAMIAATQLDAAGARLADHVLVDEAQDLTPARLMLLRALVAEGKNDLFLAEDSHQRIYGQRIVLSKYGINIRGRSRRLTLNYRTTHENLAYALRVLGDQAAYEDLEAEGASASGYRAARRGPTPEMMPATSLAEEYEAAAELLGGWVEEVGAGAAEALGVLVHAKGVAEALQRALAERGIEAQFVGPDKEVTPGKVVIMTMHRAKGMEFSHVLLFGIDTGFGAGAAHLRDVPEADRADAELRERSLLYVAATRARDRLVVMWKGQPSELLPASG